MVISSCMLLSCLPCLADLRTLAAREFGCFFISCYVHVAAAAASFFLWLLVPLATCGGQKANQKVVLCF